MYNLEGIRFILWERAGFSTFMIIFSLYWSFFWKPSERNLRALLFTGLGVVGLIIALDFGNAYYNPHIVTFEGKCVDELGRGKFEKRGRRLDTIRKA